MSAVQLPTDISHAGWLHSPETRAVFAALTANRHQARAVGGIVRDTLLGADKTSIDMADIDIATTALPEEVIGLARAAGLTAVPTGIAHGTITVIANHVPFEVTTLRHDLETFGRHARVGFTSDWKADAMRRDFSINAIYADPDGTILDPLHGRDDLAAGRVRFIGEPVARIREDYLRILRFFRFHARYGRGALDPAGLRSCVAERAGIDGLSGERLHAELMKILALPRLSHSIEPMYECGLLLRITGLVATLKPLQRLRAIEAALGLPLDPLRGLAVLNARIIEDVHHLALRLRLSNAEKARLKHMIAQARSIGPSADHAQHERQLYRFGQRFWSDIVLYNWTHSGADAGHQGWRQLLELPAHWSLPHFPLNGDDLMQLGIPTGPRIGQILEQLEADWVAARFSYDRNQLLARARAFAAHTAQAEGQDT